MTALSVVIGTVGIIVGVLLGWFLASLRARSSESHLEIELRQQIGEWRRQGEKNEIRIDELQKELLTQSTTLSTSQADLKATHNLLLEKQTLYEKQLKEDKESQAKAIVDLREAFRALSAEALAQNAPEFLRLATESFAKFHEVAKGDLVTRQESIVGLLEPLNEQLRTYQQRL